MIPLQDSHASGRFPYATILFIAINCWVFYLELITNSLEVFFTQYALVPNLIDFGHLASLTSLITSQFVHGGWLHIGSNMLFLWVFGDNVEERFGLWFIPFYLIAGAVGAIAQYLFSTGSDIPILGASGAIAGVLGAYMVFFPHHTIKTLVPAFGFLSVINISAPIMLGYWIITQILAGVGSIGAASGSGGVAYMAHIGGFVFGWLVASALRKNNTKS